jgi:hypothetical protein
MIQVKVPRRSPELALMFDLSGEPLWQNRRLTRMVSLAHHLLHLVEGALIITSFAVLTIS